MSPRITIEEDGSHDTGVCDCCGAGSRAVWGHVFAAGDRLGVYYVNWTLGHVAEHGANFDLVLGQWHDGAAVEDRRAVSLAYRVFDSGPAFMVIDAAGRTVGRSPLVGVAMARSEVIGRPIADLAFAVVDAICLGDRRIGELGGRMKCSALP